MYFPQTFSLIFHGLHNIDLQTITAPLNLQNGSFLKPFKKRATRVLSDLRHTAITSCFKSDKTMLVFSHQKIARDTFFYLLKQKALSQCLDRAIKAVGKLAKHSAIVSFFTPFLQHQVLTISNNIKYQVLTITLCT